MKIVGKKLILNKKGVELSLNTVVLFIIAVIVLIVITVYFLNTYGDNNNTVINVGRDAIDYAKDFS